MNYTESNTTGDFASSLTNYSNSYLSTKVTTIQQAIQSAVQTLDVSSALPFLDLCEHNNHTVFCEKAYLYSITNQHHNALSNCIQAFKFSLICPKCLPIYLKTIKILKIADFQTILKIEKKITPLKHQFYSSILNTLNKVKDELQTKFQRFFQTYRKKGAEFHKIQLSQSNIDCRKVLAKENISKGQTIIYIPRASIITLELANESRSCQELKSRRPYLYSPKHCILAIYLLQQIDLGENSQHYEYLRWLPNNFDTFPVNYGSQIRELQGSPFYDQVQCKIFQLKKDYETITYILPEFKKYSYEQFVKARLTVSSRVFGISIGKIKTDALVPFADMLNHHIPKQTSWQYSEEREGFIMQTLKRIEKGSEIYDSYGQKCNSRFLQNYGFTLNQNNANQVGVYIPFPEEILEQIQRSISTVNGYFIRLSMNINSKQFFQFISCLRFCTLSQRKPVQNIQQIKSIGFISNDHEIKMWELLKQILTTQLNKYPTSLYDDKKILAAKYCNQNVYNCVNLRKGQKEILLFYLKMADKVIHTFNNNLKDSILKTYQPYFNSLRLFQHS